jgi:hypothetical protein
MIMLVLVAYLGYHILTRQEAARARQQALLKADTCLGAGSPTLDEELEIPLARTSLELIGLEEEEEDEEDEVCLGDPDLTRGKTRAATHSRRITF